MWTSFSVIVLNTLEDAKALESWSLEEGTGRRRGWMQAEKHKRESGRCLLRVETLLTPTHCAFQIARGEELGGPIKRNDECLGEMEKPVTGICYLGPHASSSHPAPRKDMGR